MQVDDAKRKVKAEDMTLSPPESLREIVEDSLHATTHDDWQQGKAVEAITEERVDALMEQVYAHIEREALRIYGSNEVWALKAWALQNIFNNSLKNEATAAVAEQIMSPIQNRVERGFNPIQHVRERLEVERKNDHTKSNYLRALAGLVEFAGRKRAYSDEEIEEYAARLSRRYPKTNSYRTILTNLLQALRRLPGGRNRDFSVRLPKVVDDLYQPTFTFQEIEALTWACAVKYVKPDTVVRLCLATILGLRSGELAEIGPKDIRIEKDSIHVTVRTEKGGQRRTQPLPLSLAPIFDIPIDDNMNQKRLARELGKLCAKARVLKLPKAGFHAIRRRVVTELYAAGLGELAIRTFMRWAMGPGLGVLPTYVKIPTEKLDYEVLHRHPFSAIWEEAVPYVVTKNRLYRELRRKYEGHYEYVCNRHRRTR